MQKWWALILYLWVSTIYLLFSFILTDCSSLSDVFRINKIRFYEVLKTEKSFLKNRTYSHLKATSSFDKSLSSHCVLRSLLVFKQVTVFVYTILKVIKLVQGNGPHLTIFGQFNSNKSFLSLPEAKQNYSYSNKIFHSNFQPKSALFLLTYEIALFVVSTLGIIQRFMKCD